MLRQNDQEGARLLSDIIRLGNCGIRAPNQRVDVYDDQTNEHTSAILPAGAFELLLDVLTQMAEGNAVTLLPTHAEVTTQQAADLLNVSRPFLISSYLDTQKLPHRRVGTRRRILLSDLLAFKEQQDSQRHEALLELAEQEQDEDWMS
jgi:excisionase family DNA binding protein